MPHKAEPVRRPFQPNLYKVDTLNSAKLIVLLANKLCKTSIRHQKNPKQSGVVLVDSCFATIVAYQEGVTNREELLKNKPLALI